MLAKNVAHQAILTGHTALFTTAADLLLDLNVEMATRKGLPTILQVPFCVVVTAVEMGVR